MTEIKKEQDSIGNMDIEIQELEKQEKQIQEIIENRQKQASEKQIMKKVNSVLDILGDYLADHFKYQDSTFTLIAEDDYYEVDLTQDNITPELVFKGRCEYDIKRIDLYIPGKWEDHLELLYQKALITQKQQEIISRLNKISEVRQEWKISEIEFKKKETSEIIIEEPKQLEINVRYPEDFDREVLK